MIKKRTGRLKASIQKVDINSEVLDEKITLTNTDDGILVEGKLTIGCYNDVQILHDHMKDMLTTNWS